MHFTGTKEDRKMVITNSCAKSWSFWTLNFPPLLHELGCQNGAALPQHMVGSPTCQQSYVFPEPTITHKDRISRMQYTRVSDLEVVVPLCWNALRFAASCAFL